MTDSQTISVFDITGELGLSRDHGEVLAQRLRAAMSTSGATVDFTGVTIIASPFLNASFGQLMKDWTPEQVSTLLSVVGLEPQWKSLLDTVLINGYSFYHDAAFRESVADALKALDEE